MLIGVDVETFHRLSLDDQFELELWCINEGIEFDGTWQIVLMDESANELWHCYYLKDDKRCYATDQWTLDGDLLCKVVAHGERKHRTKVRPNLGWMAVLPDDQIPTSMRTVSSTPTASERGAQ